jgi:hypothetical protein
MSEAGLMENDDDETELPFIIKCDVGSLPDSSVAIQITYATSAERFDNRQWDKAVFAMSSEIAKSLAKALRVEIGEEPKPPRPLAN